MSPSDVPGSGRASVAPSPTPSTPTALLLAERLFAALRGTAAAIASRRGMALTLTGGFVLALAWIGERDSAWGFPMLIAGAVMIGLGLLGPRLSGSMSLRWGDDGTFLQLASTIAPPGQRRSAPQLEDSQPLSAEKSLTPPSEIEGQAETIDFKVTAAPDAE